jgi:hypothetical protein
VDQVHVAVTTVTEEIMMNIAQNELTSGIEPELFHLLVVGTSIRGKEVKLALEEHLVHGTPKKEACLKHGANFSQFSSRLGALKDEYDRASRMAKFYNPLVMLLNQPVGGFANQHAVISALPSA